MVRVIFSAVSKSTSRILFSNWKSGDIDCFETPILPEKGTNLTFESHICANVSIRGGVSEPGFVKNRVFFALVELRKKSKNPWNKSFLGGFAENFKLFSWFISLFAPQAIFWHKMSQLFANSMLVGITKSRVFQFSVFLGSIFSREQKISEFWTVK